MKIIPKSVFITNKCFYGNMVKLFTGWNALVLDSPEQAEYIVFAGGADINPGLYGQNNTHSYTNPHLDEIETGYYHKYPDKKRIGICRGAQLLCVLSGGKLWQDTDRHEEGHKLIDVATGKKEYTTSIHHQMMRPPEDASLIAVADVSTYVQGGGEKLLKSLQPYQDVEVMYVPRTRSYCFQGHPELGGENYFFEKLRQTVGVI